jgi:hypothetical protein
MIKPREALATHACENIHKCTERLQSRLARLSAADPHWDLLYLGRWAPDAAGDFR